jgi:hypothetical protein
MLPDPAPIEPALLPEEVPQLPEVFPVVADEVLFPDDKEPELP